jgi:prepilin-type N-terminal cleavage/methylation domain-containing protein
MMMPQIKSQPQRKAFSLLEVLVASAVLSILLTILLGTLSTSMSLWRNTENKLSADREARSAELLLAQDLSSVIMPSSPALWPRTNNGALQFLTIKPQEYQSSGSGANTGDVCFVEYYFDTNSKRLTRLFYPSAVTFDRILNTPNPAFPAPTTEVKPDAEDSSRPQTLATNVLANNRDAVRANKTLFQEMSELHFVLLSTNHTRSADGNDLLPIEGSYSLSNRPVALEVNFAVADTDTLANEDLLNQAGYVLRNAGLYSFRIILPRPAESP